MLKYSVCLPAPWHIKENLPCQDAFAVEPSSDGFFVIAAVADGLGSELYSDLGAQIGSKTAVAYCAERITNQCSEQEIMRIIRNSFAAAYKAILERAKKDNNDRDEYDTTLCLVAFHEESGKLYFAQSGDSGIVALTTDGNYQPLTTQQRDEDGYVQPLCFGPDYWKIDSVEKIAAVALMTDGLFEQICPIELSDSECKVNVYLFDQFMHRNTLTAEDMPEIESAAVEYVSNIPSDKVDDDKTIVCLFRENVPVQEKEKAYYSPLNWSELRKRQFKQAPSDLYDSTQEVESDQSTPQSTENALINEGASVEQPDTKPPPNISHDNSSDYYVSIGKHKLSKKAIDIGILLIVAIISVTIWLLRDAISTCFPISYLSLFVVCTLCNATILLPASSILVAMEYEAILHSPLEVAFVGGLGASVGEMVGFAFGARGANVVRWKFIKKIEAMFPKHPTFWVFLFSFLPLPIFDVIGIWAGAARMNKLKFWLACLAGKVLKMLVFIQAGKAVSDYLRG